MDVHVLKDIDFPDLVLHDGPEVHLLNVERKCNHGANVKNWFGMEKVLIHEYTFSIFYLSINAPGISD